MQLELFATLSDVTFADSIVDRLSTEPSLWCAPELLRRSALRQADTDVADKMRLLRKSRELAVSQGALAFELRTAISLTELAAASSDGEAALAELACVVERARPGGNTADFRRAISVLNT
jgi:hypothetical protein